MQETKLAGLAGGMFLLLVMLMVARSINYLLRVTTSDDYLQTVNLSITFQRNIIGKTQLKIK